MEITAEMLFYRLSKKHALLAEHIGTSGLTVREIRVWTEDGTTAADTLYLLKSANDLPASVWTSRAPGCFLVCGPYKASKSEFLPEDTYAILIEETTPEQLQTELFTLYNDLIRWDAQFSKAILRKENAKKIMSWGREMLEWGYAIIDADLKNLYSTPDYAAPWEVM